MAREYGEFCGLARALELVGGRWSMLVVRELLAGPKRYSELMQGLPGIPTNILSSRLRELAEGGLVQRELQAGRTTSVVYALTPYGRELEDPLTRLGLWGARSLGTPTSDDCFSCAALQMALGGVFDREVAAKCDLAAEIRFDQRSLHVCVTGGEVTFPSEPPPGARLVLDTAPHVFAELFAGDLDLAAAIESGQVRIEGTRRDARRFFDIFHLPRKEPVHSS